MSRLILVLLVFLVSAAPIDAGGSWIGKQIITKKPIKLEYTDNSGKQVYIARVLTIVYTVLKEEDGRLQVRYQGQNEWFEKKDAVLVENAVAFFTDRIRQNPNDADAYSRRATTWYLTGEFEIALKDANDAVRLDPTNADNVCNRGIYWSALKRFDKAIADYTEAIRLNPSLANAYSARGSAFNATKEYDKAISDYNESIRLEPKEPKDYTLRGISYGFKNEHDKAIADFTEAIRIDPQYVFAYGNRAYAYSKKKDYERTISDYTDIVRIAPKFAAAHNSLAWLMATCPNASVRNGTKAIDHAKKACELTNWKIAENIETLAAAYAEDRRYQEAVTWQKKAIEIDPKNKKYQERLKLYEQRMPYRQESRLDRDRRMYASTSASRTQGLVRSWCP